MAHPNFSLECYYPDNFELRPVNHSEVFFGHVMYSYNTGIHS